MDAEVAIYWPRLFTVPIGLITFMMAGFAFIGAQKAGTAYKNLKYPEGKPEKKVEEEVLEAAEAEHRGEQIGVPEVATPEIEASLRFTNDNWGVYRKILLTLRNSTKNESTITNAGLPASIRPEPFKSLYTSFPKTTWAGGNGIALPNFQSIGFQYCLFQNSMKLENYYEVKTVSVSEKYFKFIIE